MRSLALLFLCAACVGDIDAPRGPQGPGGVWTPGDPNQPIDPNNPGKRPPPDLCAGITIAAAPSSLRRLTVEQLTSSYRDVLKDQAAAPDLAPIAGPIITELE